MGGTDYFCCDVCNAMCPLTGEASIAVLQCECMVCWSCAREHIQANMKPQQLQAAPAQPAPGGEMFAVGQEVRYRDRHHNLVMAVVVQVDRSIQPPQYGIRLAQAAADEIRFTEQSRLLPGQASIQQGLPVIPCPRCHRVVERPVLASLFPDTLLALEDTLTNAWLQTQGVMRCPSCQALIEKVPAAPGPVQCSCSKAGSSCRCEHKQQHRLRCAACSKDFCDSCFAIPYHEGLNCEEAAAPHCPLCDTLVLAAMDMQTSGLSTKQLRQEATALGMDCSWCLERSELLEAYKRAKQTCEACRPRLKMMCSKLLPCHHWCAGVRGSSTCLPCLQAGCDHQAAAVGEGSCFICWEPLVSAAVVQLECAARHFVHLACAKERLRAGCPGPALTFDYLFCPLCGSGSEGRCGNVQVMTAQPHLQHDLLAAELQQALTLREAVVKQAKARLKLSGAAKEDAELLSPGGKYDGRPVDYALAKYQFFACSKCRQPYFGGLKACGADGQQAGAGPAPYDASELVCGSCSALAAGQNCPQHGSTLIEWKCKYCCQVASWFCWGTTHMCSRCHDHPDQRAHTCPGRGRCVLAVPHPEPGSTFCLGCGVCRSRDQL